MHTLTDSTSGAESEVIANIRVGVGGGLGQRIVVVLVSFGLETARVRVAYWVVADCVDVIKDAAAFGD